MKNLQTLLVTSLLLLFLAVPAVQAQVTYAPNYAASDFSTLASNGTATIRYDLQGAPADSPFGSSFTIAFSIGPVVTTSGTPMTIDHSSGYTFQTDPATWDGVYFILGTAALQWSNPQVSDLIHRESTPGGNPNYAGDMMETAFNGDIDAKYSFSFETSALPTNANWAYTSGGLTTQSFGSAAGGPDWQNALFLQAENSIGPNGNQSLQSLGTDVNVDIFYTYRGTNAAAALLNAQLDGEGNAFAISFQALTFTPVPEPGAMLLIGAAGALLLFSRHRKASKN